MTRPPVPKQKANSKFPGRRGAEYIVDYFFLVLHEAGITMQQIGERAGLPEETLKKWYHKKSVPRLDKVVACLEILGYELAPVYTEVEPSKTDPYYPITVEWLRLHQAREAHQGGSSKTLPPTSRSD